MPSGEPFLIIRKSSYGAPGIPSKPREKVMKRHNHDVNLPNREWRGELFRSRHIITDVASGISTKTYVDILPEFSLHIRDRRGCTYYFRKKRRGQRWKRRNKRCDTFARLARRRIERTNRKPNQIRLPSNRACCQTIGAAPFRLLD